MRLETLALPTIALLLAPGSAVPAQTVACTSAPFKSITIEYDPVTDRTTATAEHSFQWTYQITAQASHGGRVSPESAVPRLWLNSNDATLSASDLAVLLDDSARFAWKNLGMGVNVGMAMLQYLAYAPPADQFARFAGAKKAQVVAGDVRATLTRDELKRFAELARWAACPSDRPMPKTRK